MFARRSKPFQLLALIRQHQRCFASEAIESEDNLLLKGFGAGALKPRIVEFQFDIEQAKKTFQRWHAEKWLAPTKLLDQPTSSIRPVLLPFWLFEVSVKVQHSATLGFAVEGRQDGSMLWRQSDERVRHREYPWTLGSMQIYASYNHRRDFIEAVKMPGSLTRTRSLQEAEAVMELAMAGRGLDRRVEIDPPSMRQSVAWELAMRNIRMREVARAEEMLKHETHADVVKDIRIKVSPTRRRARIVYFPAYIAQYTFGEYIASTGERKPQRFLAVISGMGEGQVMGERHLHPRKAQLLTAGAIGSTTLVAGALAAYGWGGEAQLFLGVESAFWMLIAGASAGIAAKLAPHFTQARTDDARQRADEADMERIMKAGLGPLDTGDEEALQVRSNTEWRRWEEADLWRWNAARRQEWAEGLVRAHHNRSLVRKRFVQQQREQRERQEQEEQREARRRERFGPSAHEHARAGDPTFGAMSAGRWDFLGYYELLGLSPARTAQPGEAVSDSEVKKAYRAAALRWHPDRRKALAEEDQPLAQQRFQELGRAYEVLRDPALRRKYDTGQLAAR